VLSGDSAALLRKWGLDVQQERRLALGMNDFVTKPIDSARLRAAIARSTAARRAAT
jgi:CheY-like chemotaxis protein